MIESGGPLAAAFLLSAGGAGGWRGRQSRLESRCGVSEITIHSWRSNWPGARREGGSVSAAILDRLSNEAPGQFQRNPKGGMSFGRRRCCSLLTDPLRDMLRCPCGSTSRLASAQNPLPRMYSYFGDTTLAANSVQGADSWNAA